MRLHHWHATGSWSTRSLHLIHSPTIPFRQEQVYPGSTKYWPTIDITHLERSPRQLSSAQPTWATVSFFNGHIVNRVRALGASWLILGRRSYAARGMQVPMPSIRNTTPRQKLLYRLITLSKSKSTSSQAFYAMETWKQSRLWTA
jgi:hypothetical protein